MTREIVRVVLSGALVCLTAAVTLAQTTTTSETKKFQIIAVDGNQLVVKLPEGTRELTVPDDFRFNVDGKMLSVHELKPGMAGTATITTKTTTVPVTVTEVKNGTVMQAMGTSIIVRTDDGIKMFSQSDIDKRGVKIMREGKPAQISDFRANDKLTATIITTKPPRDRDREGSAGDACQEQCRCRDARRFRAATASTPPPAAAPPSPRQRPRALRRRACPRPPASCRFFGSWASRRSLRGWASPSGGVARRASRFAHRRRAALVMEGAARRSTNPRISRACTGSPERRALPKDRSTSLPDSHGIPCAVRQLG